MTDAEDPRLAAAVNAAHGTYFANDRVPPSPSLWAAMRAGLRAADEWDARAPRSHTTPRTATNTPRVGADATPPTKGPQTERNTP